MEILMIKYLYAFLGMVVLVGSMSGCGDPRAQGLVPAAGTLYYDDKPLGGAMIVFHNEADQSKQGGSAFTNQDGSFALNMFKKGDGTFPGTYKVTVSKIKVVYPISDEELAKLELQGRSPPPGKSLNELPDMYGDKNSTDITIEIPTKGNKQLRIDLSGK